MTQVRGHPASTTACTRRVPVNDSGTACTMPGWLHVGSQDLRTDDELARWVQAGTGYARSLAAKQ